MISQTPAEIIRFMPTASVTGTGRLVNARSSSGSIPPAVSNLRLAPGQCEPERPAHGGDQELERLAIQEPAAWGESLTAIPRGILQSLQSTLV